MAEDQKDRYIQYLAEQNQDLRLTGDAMKLVLEDFMAQMKELKDQMSVLESNQEGLQKELSGKSKLCKSLERKLQSTQEKLDYANEQLFDDRRHKVKSKTPKSNSAKADSDRQKEKDDYDGTDDTLRTDSVTHDPFQEVKEPSFPLAIFFYENGSRGREVLTDFLGDAELKSIMSDGYNAYVFIGNELKSAQFKDTIHQVCMSHAKNKFVKASNQGSEPNAERFSEILKEFFMRERRYDDAGLSPKERFPTQRNNSLHYGSDAGAEMAATYHSVIGTVKLHGNSVWNFIGTFFKNIFNGCRDYVNMVPGKITLATGQC